MELATILGWVALEDDPNSALLVYSDSYYPDEAGVKRKSILACRIAAPGSCSI